MSVESWCMLWIKAAHYVVITPQSAHTNEISVKVMMVDDIVQCVKDERKCSHV